MWKMSGGMVAVPSPLAPCSITHRLAVPVILLLATLTGGHASGCPRPSGVQHGWVNLTETNRGSVPLGTLLQYSCDPGYVLDGPSIITCTTSGHWSYEPPLCIRTDDCQPPSEPENGGYTCHPTPCHRLAQGTVIEYFCDEGFALKGVYNYRTCQNGEWDAALQVSCHLSQGKDEHSPLAMPALSIVASTASSVALILLLVVLFVLLQPKLKSLHHSRALCFRSQHKAQGETASKLASLLSNQALCPLFFLSMLKPHTASPFTPVVLKMWSTDHWLSTSAP